MLKINDRNVLSLLADAYMLHMQSASRLQCTEMFLFGLG